VAFQVRHFEWEIGRGRHRVGKYASFPRKSFCQKRFIASDHIEYSEKIYFGAERRAVKPKLAKRESSLYEAPVGCRIESVVGDGIAPIAEANSTGLWPDCESDMQNRPSRP
jgi:hypothetical protein